MKLSNHRLAVSILVTALLPNIWAQEFSAHSKISVSTATARLSSINNSGVKAHLSFANDSNNLIVTGVATGLDPTKEYVSLVYNAGSVATGPQACLPTNTSVSWYQMVLAYWLPKVGTSTRYLVSVKWAPSNSSMFTAFVPINAVGTTSVRMDTQPGQPLPATANPQRFVLQACGNIQPAADATADANESTN